MFQNPFQKVDVAFTAFEPDDHQFGIPGRASMIQSQNQMYVTGCQPTCLIEALIEGFKKLSMKIDKEQYLRLNCENLATLTIIQYKHNIVVINMYRNMWLLNIDLKSESSYVLKFNMIQYCK